MSFENFKINLKDVIQIVIYAVLGALAFSAQSAKIDKVITSVSLIQADNSERKQDEKDKSSKKEIYDQQILNQINTNTIQIKLLEQDIKFLKESKK